MMLQKEIRNGMVLNIAMDGPVGAGKSSIADAVARELGILHLDTGAMYRALGLTALRRGIQLEDEAAVTELAGKVDITVSYDAAGQRTMVDGEDVTALIRTPEVSMAASAVGRYLGVRRELVAIQQRLAATTPMLVDGRDVCLRILPEAPVKLYLTASAEERARRRWLEMQQKGDNTPYETVLSDLRARDEQDMNREVDPLRPTEDATIVDSTSLSFDEVVSEIIRIVKEKYHE